MSRLVALLICSIVFHGVSVALPHGGAAAKVNVLTRNYDNLHSSTNTLEAVLTHANVNSRTFGKRFTYAVDGQLYAQPLYASQVSVNRKLHNVVYVATENDSVYAFDADSGAENPTHCGRSAS